MSDFDLVPVDGGDPIHLPPGETVVGRGPLLRVNDKRVSRHHGLLENLNGELRLKPTHVNPCFVQSSLTDDPRPLQRDSWYPLHHGDLFSLLPGQYIYKVVAVGGGDCTPRNSQMFEEEEEEEEGLPVSHKPDVEPPPPIRQDSGQTPPDEEPTAAALSNQDDTPDSPDRSLNKGDCVQPKEVEDDQSEVTPSEPKRRVLPAWMMAAAAHTSSSSPKAKKQRSKGAAAASTSTKRTAAKPAKTSSPEEAEFSEEEMPKKRRRKMHVEEEEEKAAPSKTDVPSERPTVRLQTESNRSEVSDEADSFTMEVEEEERGGGASTAHINTMTPPYEGTQPENEDKKLKNGRQTTKRAEPVGSNSGSVPGAAALKPHLRTPCPYGKDCYRKNPIHFQECSHPGDTDYEEEEETEEETEEADRPECPYGTDCYRKNPLHRKEYKHTKRPAYTTRTIPKKTPAGDEDEDEDEDLEDDSFINDDSEDVGDDSDYIPPDSDDSGKEDIKRLQKEAKAFVKRRK